MTADQPSSRSSVARDDGLEAFEFAWDHFFAAVRRARGRAAGQTRRGELTLAQFHLLSPLSGQAEAAVGELAESAGVAKPTATRMLAALDRDGIVVRSQSAPDRRVVKVTLTTRGRQLVLDRRKHLFERRRLIFESLSPADRETAERLLRRLADAVDEL